ncbi:MAG: DUF1318 domain-containing protein [Verrucomicrobiales bacterium]|nr:DUF1318 domain-containing protein [Verrucomicrobiales bacterium]
MNVSTTEPLKVDLSMEVHVYQHGKPDAVEQASRKSYQEAMTNRRNRMKEIQELKNNRIVGENRQGLLSIRSEPAGDYGAYVKKTVDAENADRTFLIEHEAREKDTPVEDVGEMQWRHWQRKSFPGEWIEVEDETDGEYRWVQKQGAGGGTTSPTRQEAEKAPQAPPAEETKKPE